MTLTAVPELKPLSLDSAGGFVLPVNCPTCGGGFLIEASSRGREDIATPCREVRQVLFCEPCKERYVLLVQLGIATRTRAPEKRWTK